MNRFDARLIAAAFRVPSSTIAAAIGKDPADVRRRPNDNRFQEGLGRLALAYTRLLHVHASDRAASLRWLNAPNRALEDQARPITLLEHARLDVLERLVDALEQRQPL